MLKAPHYAGQSILATYDVRFQTEDTGRPGSACSSRYRGARHYLFAEPATPLRLICIALILSGIVDLKLVTQTRHWAAAGRRLPLNSDADRPTAWLGRQMGYRGWSLRLAGR
jgi:hypothetical protein